MSAADASREARRWLRFAREDLATADHLAQQDGMAPRQACWLAQQAAEKALKALLVDGQVAFPERHDLDELRLLVPEPLRYRPSSDELAFLSEWAVEGRYPGDWPDATRSDADRAVRIARQVVEHASKHLPQRD